MEAVIIVGEEATEDIGASDLPHGNSLHEETPRGRLAFLPEIACFLLRLAKPSQLMYNFFQTTASVLWLKLVRPTHRTSMILTISPFPVNHTATYQTPHFHYVGLEIPILIITIDVAA